MCEAGERVDATIATTTQSLMHLNLFDSSQRLFIVSFPSLFFIIRLFGWLVGVVFFSVQVFSVSFAYIWLELPV